MAILICTVPPRSVTVTVAIAVLYSENVNEKKYRTESDGHCRQLIIAAFNNFKGLRLELVRFGDAAGTD